VIGYDARRNAEFGVSSRRLAHLTAAVFLSKGGKVQLYSQCVATPFVPFLLLSSEALCGVVVTASHNPKLDNGYKVYGSNGAQICNPVDEEISASILSNMQRWTGVAELLDPDSGDLTAAAAVRVTDPFETACASYFSAIRSSLCDAKEKNENSKLKFVYTAMHGVGYPFTSKMLQEFGFKEDQHIFVEEKQRDPNPEFPTVSFPNPEEKGALDLSIEKAVLIQADYVIANDPDADRFTAAERCSEMQYKQFTGDELGVLFADWMIQRATSKSQDVSKGLLVNSAVSSKMLEALARHYGCVYSDALTGFKWLANRAASLCEENGLVHLLAYEEAIGYQLSPLIRDKDGVSAAAVFCELATHWASEGTTARGRLQTIYGQVGFFATHNGYYLCHDPAVMKSLFDDFRNGGRQKTDDTTEGKRPKIDGEVGLLPGGFPSSVGCLSLRSVRDVTRGIDTANPDLKSHLPATPNDQMLTLFFDGGNITLRGSGTEPKLKYYAEASAGSQQAAKAAAEAIAKAVIEEVLKPEASGLQLPGK